MLLLAILYIPAFVVGGLLNVSPRPLTSRTDNVPNWRRAPWLRKSLQSNKCRCWSAMP